MQLVAFGVADGDYAVDIMRFDLPSLTPTRATKFLIVSVDLGEQRAIVGLIVDRVSEPLRVPRNEIKPAPRLSVSERAFFTGVVGHHGKMLMVLDVDALLSSAEKLTLS